MKNTWNPQTNAWDIPRDVVRPGCGQYVDPGAEPNIDKHLPAKRLTTKG